MVKRILIMLTAGFIATPGSRAAAAADTLQCNPTMSSFECSFVRRQWFQGQSRNAQGRFYFDGQSRRACYDYGGALRYRFIVNDTAVFGIDKKNNAGYALARSDDSAQYDELCSSVHLFGQFLRSVTEAADRASDSVRASVDSCVYLTKKTGNGCDILAISRETGLPILVESFDENGAMVEQSRMTYGTKKNSPALPTRVIVRMKRGNVLTTDTLIISSVRTTAAAAPEPFAVPQQCRLYAFHDIREKFSPFVDKKQ
jgi:hypothetical protein